MREQNIQRLIMLALSEAGCLVWRNNCGMLKNEAGIPIKFGLGNPGGSDLIGLTSNGRFFAIEVKTPTGKPTKQQLNFIEQVKSKGGLAGIARSPDDALRIINEE